MSSEFMTPIMRELMDLADVIAPDTPGYGSSDALPTEMLNASEDLSPYVDWFCEFVDILGLDKVGLYGTATGAQVAIEIARRCPARLDFLILDNAAHFSHQERSEIMQQYFPEITPKTDGSHLQQVWKMASGLFQWFPWYAQDEEHRISEELPAAQFVHATALAYLLAGEDYAQAYRRAFLNEDASRVQSIKVPVNVIRWTGSVLKRYADRYDNFSWPAHIKMRHCDGGVESRFAAIKSAVAELQVQTQNVKNNHSSESI